MQTLCCVFVSHPHENDENDVSFSMKTQNFENNLQSEKRFQSFSSFSCGRVKRSENDRVDAILSLRFQWNENANFRKRIRVDGAWVNSLHCPTAGSCQTWTAQTSWVGIRSRQFSSKIIKPSFHFCFKQCQNDSRTFVVGTSILFFRFIDPVLTVQTAIYKSYCSLEVGRHCVAQDRRLPGTRKACLNFISLRHDKLFVFALELEARFQSWEFVAKSLLSLQ